MASTAWSPSLPNHERYAVQLDNGAARLVCFGELLLCPQDIKLSRIAWIHHVAGQSYVATAVKGAGQSLRPLRHWQRHARALQQYKVAICWATGRSNCQHRPAYGDAGNSRRDVTYLKKIDLGRAVGRRQDQGLPAGTVRYKRADNVLSGAAVARSIGKKGRSIGATSDGFSSLVGGAITSVMHPQLN